jgi:hypothetical protein
MDCHDQIQGALALPVLFLSHKRDEALAEPVALNAKIKRWHGTRKMRFVFGLSVNRGGL